MRCRSVADCAETSLMTADKGHQCRWSSGPDDGARVARFSSRGKKGAAVCRDVRGQQPCCVVPTAADTGRYSQTKKCGLAGESRCRHGSSVGRTSTDKTGIQGLRRLVG